jgi:hypothetical protein
VEVLNQHNVPTRIIDQPDQDSPTIRRNGQAGPTTGGLVELADSLKQFGLRSYKV